MNKIKNTITLFAVISIAMLSMLSLSLASSQIAKAEEEYIHIGSIIRESDGSVSVDWKWPDGTWHQQKLVQDPNQTDKWTSSSSSQNNVFTIIVRVDDKFETDKAVVRVCPGDDVNCPGAGLTTNYTLASGGDTTTVSRELYTEMQKVLAQHPEYTEAQARQEAQKALDAKNTGPGGDSAEGGGECGVKNGTNLIKCDPKDNAMQSMILQFTNAFFAGVGILCVFGIVMGGIVYITAGGDASRTKQGITYIVNAVIGLVIFIFLFMLLNFMVPGGFFNNAGFEPADPPVNIDNTDPEDNQICTGPSCYSPY